MFFFLGVVIFTLMVFSTMIGKIPGFFFGLWLSCAIIISVGWVLNLIVVIQLINSDAALTIKYAARLIGVIAIPIGTLMGYFAT